MPADRFVEALNQQITDELAASHQYLAAAVHYEAQTLPQLAGFFYAQALEERGHAMMMVKYLLDRRAAVNLREIPAPKADFPDHVTPIRLALDNERNVTEQIGNLFSIARDAGDHLGEQFIQWFLKEQVEEEAMMSDLLDVAERVRDFPMTLEEYIQRENPRQETTDPTAPEAAGGAA